MREAGRDGASRRADRRGRPAGRGARPRHRPRGRRGSRCPSPPGGRTPVDPTAGAPGRPGRTARRPSPPPCARRRWPRCCSGSPSPRVLGLTRLGARLVRAVARPLGGGWAWQVLLGVLALVGDRPAGHAAAVAPTARWCGTATACPPAAGGCGPRDVAVSTAIDAGLTALGAARRSSGSPAGPRAPGGPGRRRGAAALVVVGSFLWPVVIEPAFNRFEPLPAGAAAHRAARSWPRRTARRCEDVLVSDASRRTTALNAYVSGFGSTRRIVVYDTVLDRLPDDADRVDRRPRARARRDRRRAHRARSSARSAPVPAWPLLGWLLSLDRRCCAGPAPTAPGDPRVVPLVLFLARRRHAAVARRCRTSSPGTSRPAPTCTRST